VTDGLSGGETVVVDGQLRLAPGAKVQVQNATAQAAGAPAPSGAASSTGHGG